MALPNGIHSTQELLDANAHVWNHALNFINSMSLRCAVELGIPDVVHKHAKPMTLSELTGALPIAKAKSVFIEHLMAVLVHSKFFIKVKISNDKKEEEEEEEEGYCLTPPSLILLRDEPCNNTPLVLLGTDPAMMEPFHHLSKWFKSEADPTPFVTAHGKTFWEFMEQTGQGRTLGQLFNEGMAKDTLGAASTIVRDCWRVFQDLRSIVDVAGGTGAQGRALVDAFPGLKCVVLDRPCVVSGLEGSDNLSFVGGDMFESIPRADAVFMKCILHDWSDEYCVKILKKCKEAIPSKDEGGKVIIVDIVVGVGRGHSKLELESTGLETQLLSSMQMMALVAGKERSEKDWSKLFYDAGFSSYEIAPVLGLRSIIQVFP